ncbi:MAG: acetate--CoA ligase family protein, partial [Alicyclobacillus sp.]|nr:acetate--CoA ligase family protein [Alicyclobacillus sp.]
ALLCIPQAVVPAAVAACARRGVRAAVVFAAGFAEEGAEGHRLQADMAALAAAHGLLLAGPNCMGLTNFVDRVPLTFAPGLKRSEVTGEPALAILTQSGGLMSLARESCQARGVSLTYAISTGNEAMVGIEDYLEVLVADSHTAVIAVYAEQLRQPARFLALARQARAQGKPLVLLHPGHSQAARAAVQSHTGKLAGDHAVMRTLVEHAGVVWADSLDAWLDIAWLLTWQPRPVTAGVGVLTDSGALKTLALDWAEREAVTLPALSRETADRLMPRLPSYTRADNPLDLTAQALSEPDLYSESAAALLADPAIGSLLVAVLPGSPQVGWLKMRALLPGLTTTAKPVAVVVMGDEVPLADETVTALRTARVPLFRSPERALRALAGAARWQFQVSLDTRPELAEVETEMTGDLPVLPPVGGVLTEAEGKRLLAALGVAVPLGEQADNAEAAVAAAEQLGYPVVLKVQAAGLAHKSEVGGVVLNLYTAQDVRNAWQRLAERMAQALPGTAWRGWVEQQAAAGGTEVLVGGRRDPQWGPVVIAGFGGLGVEVWRDVVLIPPDATAAEVAHALQRLRGAGWFKGARGRPPLDTDAVVRVIQQVGRWLLAEPRVLEVEVNPLMVYPAGQGVLAVDALVVVQAPTG